MSRISSVAPVSQKSSSFFQAAEMELESSKPGQIYFGLAHPKKMVCVKKTNLI